MPKLPKGKPKCWIANSKKKVRFTEKHISENSDFYRSRAWQKVRKAFFSMNPVCKWCEEEGRTTEGRIVDHIVEIKDGGSRFGFENLQTLCQYHHNQKTNWQRMKRKKGN